MIGSLADVFQRLEAHLLFAKEEGNDRAEKQTGHKIDIRPAVIEEGRGPHVVGVGNDIGKADQQGKDIVELVFLVVTLGQIDAEADGHHVAQDQISIDGSWKTDGILPDFGT